jgi:hypothetical protein
MSYGLGLAGAVDRVGYERSAGQWPDVLTWDGLGPATGADGCQYGANRLSQRAPDTGSTYLPTGR